MSNVGEIGPTGALDAVKISGMSTATTDLDPICGPWIEVEDVRDCADQLACATDEQATEAIAAASYLLWLLSDKRYPGECETMVRPCAHQWEDRFAAPPRSSRFEWGWDSSWGWMAPWGWCCNPSHDAGSCGCGSPGRISLGQWPINSITEVEIDGDVLAADEYVLVDRRWLLRSAGENGESRSWPCCQRLDRTLGDDDTWAVTFKFGTAPPRPGKLACAAYAGQWARAMCSDDSCTLPPGIQSMVRGGLTIQFMDPVMLLQNGLTGVPTVDAWLIAERYGQKHQPAVFINPDDYAPVHRTGTYITHS